MAGAALKPDYFKSKLNLAVLLAPPAGMANCANNMLQMVSKPLLFKTIIGAINTFKFYNTCPYNKFTTTVGESFCKVLNGDFCNAVLASFSDTDSAVDNTSRYDVYMSYTPADAGWRNLAHYGQNINLKADAFLRYDYGDIKNLEVYGQIHPPAYDLGKLDFPIAIMSGDGDKLAAPKDVAWTAQQLSKSLIFNHEYHLGHMSFAIAKDMSWWTVDAMAIINHYNGKCDSSTAGSNFTEGNKKCASPTFLQE